MHLPWTSRAIQNLRPGAAWELRDEDPDMLVWNDKLQTKPTKTEIKAEALRIQAEYDATEYQRLRAPEYPPIQDYLDAVVKGDVEQQQAYIDACLAVKARYPKPEGV